MPHYPKPFFRRDRGLWYVQLRGRQHNLGANRDAFRRYPTTRRRFGLHIFSGRKVPVVDE